MSSPRNPEAIAASIVEMRIGIGEDPPESAAARLYEICEAATLSLQVLIDAEQLGAFCPGCGCDWDDRSDPHESDCSYVTWARYVRADSLAPSGFRYKGYLLRHG